MRPNSPLGLIVSDDLQTLLATAKGSPALRFKDVPTVARTLALDLVRLDPACRPRVHWLLFNLPAELTELPPNLPPAPVLPKTLAKGAFHGLNDFGATGFGPSTDVAPSFSDREWDASASGPWVLSLRALDRRLNLKAGAVRDQLFRAMDGHVLATVQLVLR